MICDDAFGDPENNRRMHMGIYLSVELHDSS